MKNQYINSLAFVSKKHSFSPHFSDVVLCLADRQAVMLNSLTEGNNCTHF